MIDHLHLNLMQLPLIIARFDVHNTKFIALEFSIIERIENRRSDNRCRQHRRQRCIEKMDQQIQIFFRSQQRLEDAIHLGVDPVAHTPFLRLGLWVGLRLGLRPGFGSGHGSRRGLSCHRHSPVATTFPESGILPS